jgi:hypothetical protein
MLTLAAADTLAAGASAASQLTSTVFGMTLVGTTETYAVLDQRQLAASPATIYTVGASTTAFIKTITVVNNDTVQRSFQFFRGGTAAANAITPSFMLLPGGVAMYEDGLGWQFFNSVGQLLFGVGASSSGLFANYGITGSLAETIPRNFCVETSSTAPTASGTLWLQGIWLTSGLTVSSISWCSGSTAAITPTNYFLALYDGSRNLRAATANQTTTAWAAQTLKTIAVVTPYVIPTTGMYYIGMFMTAATIITSKGTTARSASQLAGQAPIIQGASTTGLTTALPDPAATITVSTASVWAAVL